jgi:hypothetical protein
MFTPPSPATGGPRRLGNCITDSIYITILHDVMSIFWKRSDMLSQKTSPVDVLASASSTVKNEHDKPPNRHFNKDVRRFPRSRRV